MIEEELSLIEDRAKGSSSNLTLEKLEDGDRGVVSGWDDGSVNWGNRNDPIFFSHAREDVLKLIELIRKLKGEM